MYGGNIAFLHVYVYAHTIWDALLFLVGSSYIVFCSIIYVYTAAVFVVQLYVFCWSICRLDGVLILIYIENITLRKCARCEVVLLWAQTIARV